MAFWGLGILWGKLIYDFDGRFPWKAVFWMGTSLLLWELFRGRLLRWLLDTRYFVFAAACVAFFWVAVGNADRFPVAANEASAVNGLLTIHSAQLDFKESLLKDQDNDDIGEYATLEELRQVLALSNASGEAKTLPLWDEQLLSGKRSDYFFQLRLGCSACGTGIGVDSSERSFFAVAWPMRYGHREGGVRSFCIDESGVLRSRDVNGRVPGCFAILSDDPWSTIGP